MSQHQRLEFPSLLVQLENGGVFMKVWLTWHMIAKPLSKAFTRVSVTSPRVKPRVQAHQRPVPGLAPLSQAR